MRTLAVGLDEPPDEIAGWLNHVRLNFDNRFWNERAGLYYDMRAGKLIPVNTASTFLPLFAGLPSKEQGRHLLDPVEYAPNGEVHHWVTTTAKTEPTWEPQRYWRGPVWIIMNWFIMEGLQRYGYDDLTESIRQDTLGLIEAGGFREYYDGRNGSGCGSTDLSWSAALTLGLTRDK